MDWRSMAARIPPGTTRQTGVLNALIARVIGFGAGTRGPPALFTTLGRHRRLFRPWLRFAAGLMPRGVLPRGDAELVILRVAVLCESAYEWIQHERIAPRFGLDEAAVTRVRKGAGAPGWSARQAAIIRAVDELHASRTLGEANWDALRAAGLTDTQLIELPLLTGHYEMLAMTLNALRVPPDRFRGRGALHLLERLR
jgi:alkylhydroperoxidase family enzyme